MIDSFWWSPIGLMIELTVVFAVLDMITTFIGLKLKITVEANPLYSLLGRWIKSSRARWMIMIMYKIDVHIILIFLIVYISEYFLLLFSFLYVINLLVVPSNIYQMIKGYRSKARGKMIVKEVENG